MKKSTKTYFRRRPFTKKSYSDPAFADNDPLTGLANLFDIGLVFIVGLLVTMFSAYRLQDLFDAKSNLTILKQNENGQMELIQKKGKRIEAKKVSRKETSGVGVRLGTAYRLEDGTMVYVPDK